MIRLLPFVILVTATNVILGSPSAMAQVRFDAAVGLALPLASTSFRSLPGYPTCCPEFTSGSGVGLALGIGAELPVLEDFVLSLRGSTADLSHGLTERERVRIIVDGNLTDATIAHHIDLDQRAYAAELLLGYRLHRMTIRAGLGYVFRGPGTLATEERLEDPAGAAFVDTQSPVRNVLVGGLPDAVTTSWQIGAAIGVAFPLDEQRRWELSPEVGLWLPLSSITSATEWNLTVPSAMLRLQWSPFVESEHDPHPFIEDVATEQRHRVDTTAVDSGSAIAVSTLELDVVGDPTVVIEEVEQETFLPVLPYVFFEHDQGGVPQRYVQTLREPLPVEAEPADVFHRRLLAVIASRMQQFPDVTITLTGTTSSRERTPSLALQRASAVASILRDTFGIADDRLIVRAQGRPDNPTMATAEGDVALAEEENSRVELQSTDPRMLMPYYVADTVVVMSPPQLEFVARTTPPQVLYDWTLTVNDDQLRSSRQPYSGTVLFKPEATAVRSLLNEGELRVRVYGDINGELQTTEKTIPIEQRRLASKRQTIEGDSVIEVFQLIVFPYNSAELTPMHQRVLDMVRQRVGEQATLYIEGATDIIGTADANTELSRRRAQAVATYLGRTATVVGRGEPASDVEQTLPEQRMLERTVRIRASTQQRKP